MTAHMHQIFILSPANSGGARAALLFNPRARFELAQRLQRGEKAPLGEIFSFLSGLYFRGKLTYAARFARPPQGLDGAYVITSNRGLLSPVEAIGLKELESFSTTPIEPEAQDYSRPLRRDAKKLALAGGCAVILLGSIGTKKYAETLLDYFGERLLFPVSFVGRGDMSRGGLLLRAASEDRELEYVAVAGAVRHGKRPAKLSPKKWGYKVLSGRMPDVEESVQSKGGRQSDT